MIKLKIPALNFILSLVLGIAFILVGVYFLIFHFGRDMRIWLATRDGIEIPVIEVMDVQLRNVDGKKDAAQEVLARYTYQVNGTLYTGTLASVHQEADNFGSFHRQLYERIKAFKDQKGFLTCFVSRSDPSLAVIDNTLRPSRIAVYMLFLLVFAGLGSWAAFHAINTAVNAIRWLIKRNKS